MIILAIGVEKVERIECLNHTVVTVTHVYSSDASFHVVSFFEIVDIKLHRLMNIGVKTVMFHNGEKKKE